MKGIILAGGAGSRLHPVTLAVSKQLLPVYDKPMVYYPLSLLMLAGIRDILLISTPIDLPRFRDLLGDGSDYGIRLSYAEQPKPEGLAQAFIIGEEFLAGGPACLVLGDNILYGEGLGNLMRNGAKISSGAQVFGYRVPDPERFGVVEIDSNGRATALEEKPQHPRSHWAVPGIYFYGPDACFRAKRQRPSQRGELEITDLNRSYLDEGSLMVELLGRGIAWFDTGTHRSLLDASNFIAMVEERQGLKIACLEEIAWRSGWIDADRLRNRVGTMGRGTYASYLSGLLCET